MREDKTHGCWNENQITLSAHALTRAGECRISPAALRRQVADLSPRLASFVGIAGGRGKVGLMHRSAPSPVIRATRDQIEVVTVLRPGQRALRSDTIEVWV